MEHFKGMIATVYSFIFLGISMSSVDLFVRMIGGVLTCVAAVFAIWSYILNIREKRIVVKHMEEDEEKLEKEKAKYEKN